MRLVGPFENLSQEKVHATPNTSGFAARQSEGSVEHRFPTFPVCHSLASDRNFRGRSAQTVPAAMPSEPVRQPGHGYGCNPGETYGICQMRSKLDSSSW